MHRLRQWAQAGPLSIVSDYDGTLSPFVVDGAQALAAPGAVRATQTLAASPNTTFTILTGRSRAEIERFYRDPRNELAGPFEVDGLGFTTHSGKRGIVYVIGQHGADVDPLLGQSYATPLTQAQQALGLKIQAEIHAALAESFGYPVKYELDIGDVNVVYIERKPTGAGVHTRSFDHEHHADAVAIRAFARDFYAGTSPMEGPVYVVPGSEVLEITAKLPDKGPSIEFLREKFGAPIVFFGDDFTDVSAFETLNAEDFGIVVGAKITQTLRERGLLDSANLLLVPDPNAAVALLTELAAMRPS